MRSNPVRAGAIRYSAPLSTPAAIMHARPPNKVAQIAPTPPPSAPPAPVAREFTNVGEYLRALARAAAGEGEDPRLVRVRAPSGLSEVDPTGGGFLLPPEFSQRLIASLYEHAVIAPLCSRQETAFPGPRITAPGCGRD